MPIPPLNLRSNQNWRKNKKKYYINRSGKKSSKSKPKKTKKRPKRNWLGWLSKKNLILAVLAGLLLFFLLGFGYVVWLTRTGQIIDPGQLLVRELPETTKVYDRTGETILYEIHGDQKRTFVSLDDMPEYVKWATIAIEDKDFYKHSGFSLWAIFRTVVTNTLRGERAGGSTLTQQFVKNAVLTTQKTYTRKIKEVLISYKLEKKFTKDEILQMYLNEIPYGSTAYGIEAASQRYFGKSVIDINLAEAAVLAALPQAPSRYSPYGSNRDTLIGRQHYILDQMVEQGYIGEIKADVAKQYELEFKPPTEDILAPHFVMYVKEMLTEKYGEKMIEQGGLKIITTLDLYKQQIAEDVISEHIEKTLAPYNATNTALVSLDPKTGQILAMVGSRDYFNESIDGQVNITTSLRQPGSSLKPLIYAASFLKDFTPDTVLYDVVTNFSNDPSKPYEPHNYDLEERGPVTIRKALAGSLNIPAVKAIYLAGINNVLDLAEELGYTSFGDRNRFGLSLVLGGGEVQLIEHANAYGAFAREGLIHPLAAILKVEDKDGNSLEEFELEEKRVLDPKIARLVNNILSDNAARAYAFGENNWLTLGSRPVAAKTGTTNDYRDAWTLGYTPSLVTGVWVGNNDNSEMKRGAAGGTIAAPIWHDYMKKILGNTPIETFRTPEPIETGKPALDGKLTGEVAVTIDTASGLLATEYTPESFQEEKTFREDHCILYYVNKDDPRGDPPKDPGSDPQFALWEERVVEWAEKRGYATSAPPVEYDNLHVPENLPHLTVFKPTGNETLTAPLLTAEVSASAPRGVNRVEYYLNDALFSAAFSPPYYLNKAVGFLGNGFHSLTIRACDDIDNCTSATVEFNLLLSEPPASQEFSISWLSPQSGLALTNIDFPFLLQLRVNNPVSVAKINLFYVDKNNTTNFIATQQPVESDTASIEWPQTPATGTYQVYAEAVGWSRVSKKTEAVVLSITNTAETNAATSSEE